MEEDKEPKKDSPDESGAAFDGIEIDGVRVKLPDGRTVKKSFMNVKGIIEAAVDEEQRSQETTETTPAEVPTPPPSSDEEKSKEKVSEEPPTNVGAE